jgi:hypothetical protein
VWYLTNPMNYVMFVAHRERRSKFGALCTKSRRVRYPRCRWIESAPDPVVPWAQRVAERQGDPMTSGLPPAPAAELRQKLVGLDDTPRAVAGQPGER